MPAASGAKSAFLSHASNDTRVAQQLCSLLEAKGLRCWIAPRDVQPGCSYPDEIVRGIEECASLILLATSDAVASPNVLNEVEQAHKRRKIILTVMLGKPGISRDLDYYISRLHWIESGGTSLEEVVERLADVLRGRREWNDVASPPSLVRRFTYARHAFVGSLAASLLVLLFAAIAGYYYLSRQDRNIAGNYRSLGWVTFGSTLPPNARPPNGADVQMQIWLADQQTLFRDVRVLATTEQASGNREPIDLSSALDENSTGQMMVRVHLPPATNQITTCLIVPSAKLGANYRVRQMFAVADGGGELQISPQGSPEVKESKGLTQENTCL